jgi:hypothetical protein
VHNVLLSKFGLHGIHVGVVGVLPITPLE